VTKVPTPAPPELHHLPQHGLAELHFESRDGRTRLTEHRTRSPLTVQRALYLDEHRPDMAHVILANPTAGLLAGDRHMVDVRVAPGARAQVTTQAATKVFAMSGGHAEQTFKLAVGDAGVLEYLPRSLIPFRTSCLDQYVELVVAHGGTAVYGDVLSLGRIQSGERLEFRSLTLSLTVRRPSGPELYIESYRLNPLEGSLDATGILAGGVAAIGTLIAVTDLVTPEGLLQSIDVSSERRESGASAAVLPGGGGIVLKLLAGAASEAEEMIRSVANTFARAIEAVVKSPVAAD
jgi:urease accessory protein